jgi:uncharacterized caspase-like protein
MACVAALLTLAAAPAALAEKRLALVIGNSAYKDTPLLNPVNDARAMSQRLRQLGFDVVMRENATRAHVAAAIAEFAGKITPATVALFYYAGHGLQVRGRNYVIPVDAEIEAESAVPFAAIDVAQVVEEIDHAGARVKVMVLDACRNNPFERRLRGVGQGRGLAPMQAARGSLMAFATAPGSVAADGDGANSIYTGALLQALAEPGVKAEDVFKRARLLVLEQTRGAQTPWEQSALTGDLVLNRLPAGQAKQDKPDAEAVFWQWAHASDRADDYVAYLKQYPDGAFGALARARIAALQAQLVSPPKLALIGGAQAAELGETARPVPAETDRLKVANVVPPAREAAQAPKPPPRPPNDMVRAMMRRADALLAVNDLAGARLFYERLALEGHQPAALALARTYDPAWLRQLSVIGVPADPARAAHWYARAEAMRTGSGQ